MTDPKLIRFGRLNQDREFFQVDLSIKAINRPKMLARAYHRNDNYDSNIVSTTLMLEQMIILNVQRESFYSEKSVLKQETFFPRISSICDLNLLIDQSGILIVGFDLREP